MRGWRTNATLAFTLKDCVLSAVGHELLQEFISARAFPGNASPGLHLPPGDVLGFPSAVERLAELGIAAPSGQDRWKLTESAMGKLMHVHVVKEPFAVFKPGAELSALAESAESLDTFTAWELFEVLRHRGWSLQKTPPRKAAQQQIPPLRLHDVAQPAPQWFLGAVSSLSGARSVAYMSTLVCSKQLFDEGTVQEIHHFQPVQYYKQVLAGTSNGEAPVAIRDSEDVVAPAEAGELSLDIEPAPLLSSSTRLNCLSSFPAEPEYEDPLVKARQEFANLERHDKPANGGSGSEGEPSDRSDWTEWFLRHSSDSERAWAAQGSEPPSPAQSVVGLEEQDGGGGATAAAEAAGPPTAPPAPVQMEDGTLVGGRAVRRSAWQQHPDSFDFGPFRITYTTPEKRPPHGQWQARCLYHRLNERTACTKACQCGPNPADKEFRKRWLLTWCLQAPLYDRKRTHALAQVAQREVLPQELLDRKLLDLAPPPLAPRTDVDLDREEAAQAAAEGKASGANGKRKSSSSKKKPKAASQPKAASKKAKKRKRRGPNSSSSLSLSLSDCCDEVAAESPHLSDISGVSSSSSSSSSTSTSSPPALD